MFSLFLTHLKGLKKEAIKSPLFILAEVVLELLLPLIMSEIVDVAIPAGDTGRIFLLGGLMVVIALAAMACGVLSAKYATFASQGFGANLRQALFDKVQEFSFADIDRFSSASLITRMTNDVNALTMMLNMSLRMVFRAPAMLLFALCISFSINARLACILLVIVPVMGAAIGFDTTGVDFAMTALFIVIAVGQWKAALSHLPALLGAGATLASLLLVGAEDMLLPALAVIVAGLSLLRPRLDEERKKVAL